MEEEKNRKYILASNAMKVWNAFKIFLFIIICTNSRSSMVYVCIVLIGFDIVYISDAFFKSFIAKYAQGDQKTYSQKHIKDILIWGIGGGIFTLIILYLTYR